MKPYIDTYMVNKTKENQQNHNIQEKYTKPYQNNIIIKTYIIRRDTDIIYKIINNLSCRACKTLKKYKVDRPMTHMDLIGLEPKELKEYIKCKFTDDMSFDNYNELEVDHIKPISIYDLTDLTQLKECFNYKNLQPLSKIDNQQKSNKYNHINK
jgi:hypothetical protein